METIEEMVQRCINVLQVTQADRPNVEDGLALDHLDRAMAQLLAKQRRLEAAGVLTQPKEVKAVEDEEVASDDD